MKYAASRVLAVDPCLSPSLRGAPDLIRGDAPIQKGACLSRLLPPAHPPSPCGLWRTRGRGRNDGWENLTLSGHVFGVPAKMMPYASPSQRLIHRRIIASPRPVNPLPPMLELCKINNLGQVAG